MISSRVASDICSAIRAFEEWCLKSSIRNTPGVPAISQSFINQIHYISAPDGQDNERVYHIEQLNLRSRIASRHNDYWPARDFSRIFSKDINGESWITKTINRIIVLTDHGIHRVVDLDGIKVHSDSTLWVHPKIYKSGLFVQVLGYHADGTIQPLKLGRDKNNNPKFSDISIDHNPAISKLTGCGQFPEFSKLLQNQKYDLKVLRKEFDTIISMSTYMLMELSENSAKGNKW